MQKRSASALAEDAEADLYARCETAGITTVSVGHRASVRAMHSKVLELEHGGRWRVVSGPAVPDAAADGVSSRR